MAGEITVNETVVSVNATTSPVAITVTETPVTITTTNQGIQGATGSAGQINSVSATTLPAGSSATVVNNGSTTNAQLVFGIPTGNTGAQGNQGAGYSGVTSTTSNTLAVGSKTWALTTTLGYHAYVVGQRVRVIYDTANYAEGSITAVSATSMTVNVTYAVGSYGSTFSSWTFGVTGLVGATGSTGQGFTYRNAWVSGTSYLAYDVVTYNGSTYVCILAVSGTTVPSADATHWTLTASKGDQGNVGTAGYCYCRFYHNC
jgi:hypothetical protein